MLLDPRRVPQVAELSQPVGGGYSPTFLRLTLGVVYLHFGFLKFYPDLSPAELLASQTIMRLSLHWLDAHTALVWLAVLECAIGLGFLFNICQRIVFGLFLFHMAGTFLPLFLLPEFTFKIAPLAPTLEGQYILKNIVFVAAGWTVLFPAVMSPRKTRIKSQHAATTITAPYVGRVTDERAKDEALVQATGAGSRRRRLRLWRAFDLREIPRH